MQKLVMSRDFFVDSYWCMMGQQGVIGFSTDPCQQVNRLQADPYEMSVCLGGNLWIGGVIVALPNF